jgi:hypothetical protein
MVMDAAAAGRAHLAKLRYLIVLYVLVCTSPLTTAPTGLPISASTWAMVQPGLIWVAASRVSVVVIGFEAQPVMARAKKIVMIGFILFLGWWALPYGLLAAKSVGSVGLGLLVGAPQARFARSGFHQ